MSTDLSAALVSGLAELTLPLPEAAVAQLLQYVDLIARWNKVYNLTAVRDPQDMLTQHLLDCLAIVPPLRRMMGERNADGQPLRVLDVGSGAGLPGVVLAVTQPAWAITCVDTVGKKVSFIRQVAAELRLPHLAASHSRVQAMAEPPYDLITCRAFSSLADFIDLTRERLAPRGLWVAMKARLSAEEREAVPADVEVFHVEPIAVPGLDAERCLVWMRPRKERPGRAHRPPSDAPGQTVHT